MGTMTSSIKADPEMVDTLEALYRRFFGDEPRPCRSDRFYSFRRFALHYATTAPDDVSWNEVCEYAKSCTYYPRFAAGLIVELIDRGLYGQEHVDALRFYRDALDRSVSEARALGSFLCGPAVSCLVDPEAAEFILRAFGGHPPLWGKGPGDIDRRMLDVLRGVWERLYGGFEEDVGANNRYLFGNFFRNYAARSPESISWNEVCATERKPRWLKQHDLLLIVELLDRGLYAGDHRGDLHRLRDDICAEALAGTSTGVSVLLCGDEIEWLVSLPLNRRPGSFSWRLHFAFIGAGSPFLRKTIAEFLQSDGPHSKNQSMGNVDLLVRSFGSEAHGIRSLDDFTASLFWQQAEFIKENASGRRQLAHCAGLLRGFYVFLANSDPERDLFSSSSRMSDELLRSSSLTDYVIDGTYVTAYGPGIDLGSREKVALILRGFEDRSTSIKAEDHVLLNATCLESPFLRGELMAFWCSSPKRVVTEKSKFTTLADCLQLLHRMKTLEGHPNPSLTKVSRGETFLLRETIERGSQTPSTVHSKLSLVSTFLQWEMDVRGSIEVDRFALDHLYEYSRPRPGPAEPIPDDELSLIAARLAEKAGSGSAFDEAVFAMFCIAVDTEFRIGQICHMTLDCVKPSVKPGEYVIHSATKTSGGERVSGVITELTRRHLAAAVDATDEIRSECTAGKLGRYVFLSRERFGSPMLIKPKHFSDALKKCCEDLGLERRYTAANLRDTHMTKGVEYAIRNGSSDLVVDALSGHKRRATTYGHYVEIELEKMLEATYGIIIGDRLEVDARGKVVDRIPEEANSPEFVVEGGCGNCTAEVCAIAAALPCFVCKDFVTTVDHEPYFVRAIEAVEAKILSAETRHDADDFVTIKTVLVMFLQAIYERKGRYE